MDKKFEGVVNAFRTNLLSKKAYIVSCKYVVSANGNKLELLAEFSKVTAALYQLGFKEEEIRMAVEIGIENAPIGTPGFISKGENKNEKK